MLLRRERAMNALAIMLDVAFHAGRDAPVNASDIAERLGQARRGIEPLLQALARAGLLESTRGPRGGYRLARARRAIRAADVAAAVCADEPPDAPSGPLQAAVLLPLWDELEGLCQARLGTLTLEDLLRRAQAAGLRRPATEPLDFAI